jgi:hypothetical protein
LSLYTAPVVHPLLVQVAHEVEILIKSAAGCLRRCLALIATRAFFAGHAFFEIFRHITKDLCDHICLPCFAWSEFEIRQLIPGTDRFHRIHIAGDLAVVQLIQVDLAVGIKRKRFYQHHLDGKQIFRQQLLLKEHLTKRLKNDVPRSPGSFHCLDAQHGDGIVVHFM